jgi:Leucine-rich repeat (LRR) protein
VSEKDQVIALLLSQVDVNIQLALVLQQELGIDLSDFWIDLYKIYDSTNRRKDNNLPPSLDCLDLRRLDMRLRHPGELPWLLSQLKKMKQMTLSFIEAFDQQQAVDISPFLPLSEDMKSLTIYNCRLTDFPEQIRNYKGLKQLNLGHLSINALPDWFSELKELDHLYLIDCNIEKLPKKFLFQSIKTIHLSKNQICEIPESIFDNDFLFELYLDNNRLSKISHLISNLDLLLDLNLANNCLKEFPEGILDIKELTLLNLCNNPIHEIPNEISELKELHMLNLSGTLVTESDKEKLRILLPKCIIS